MTAGAQLRVPILYLAPWVDIGGTDKGTIDWFRWMDRDRFAPALITTQPSENRRLGEVIPYATEVWALPEMLPGNEFPFFILDFINDRKVQVVHVMNSRLGFDLLPDISALPDPPAVVVQLHVEERDRSGYVRYVTTRYGNLVDAFSITSRHLAEAVFRDYEVHRSKCHVIYTGVDADREFSPQRVRAVDGLEASVTHILYPGRLVEQKDPMLMVEIAAALRQNGVEFRIHSIGDGHLMEAVKEAIANRGLEGHVIFHGPRPDPERWFAACDIVLLTSEYEGVPYVVFEAMAMNVPVVAPALPGIVEIMGEECGATISPRDDVAAYAETLVTLVADPERRKLLGYEGRCRVRDRFSLTGMAAAHGALYESLVSTRQPAKRNGVVAPRSSEERLPPILCRDRASRGTPLVSVIVPCFNHGRYLPQCLDSIRYQTYPALETIVIDDASTDEDTLEQLLTVERDPHTMLVRLPRNSGPSAARNVGIRRARGRYVLPVDADNALLPDAVERLVDQLQAAGEGVGFIYPNLQYFGNRSDYFQPPIYNLYRLLQDNYCDTCSLIDRDVFHAGVEYAEDIRLGHEDWDFVLQLATRGIYGEPAVGKTLLYRKWGFTRSDVVTYGRDSFHDLVKARHPRLYDEAAAIKARWSPAVSIIGLDPLPSEGEFEHRLRERLRGQTCGDVEVVVRADETLATSESVGNLRRLPARLAGSPLEALRDGVNAARGRYLLAARGTGSQFLSDPAFVEKALRVLGCNRDFAAIAFVDAGEHGRFPFRLLTSADQVDLVPHAVLWPTERSGSVGTVAIDASAPISRLVQELSHAGPVQWRHQTSTAADESQDAEQAVTVHLGGRPATRVAQREEWKARVAAAPLIPARRSAKLRRHVGAIAWIPPDTQPLCRHRNLITGEYIITNDRLPPPGYALEFDLGSINSFSQLGTGRLERFDGPDGPDYRVLGLGQASGPPDDGDTLGFLELSPLPMLDSIHAALDPASNQRVLVSGDDDPLRDRAQLIAHLGWIESFPINPRKPPHAELPYRLRGLVRVLDLKARRHVYGVGFRPHGELVGELGGLREADSSESVPVWLAPDGSLLTDSYVPPVGRPSPSAAVRWTIAPLAWRGLGPLLPRLRAVARRTFMSAVRLLKARSAPARHGDPIGYLYPEGGPARVPLYVAHHPVTRDQLLTPYPMEANDMGYADITLLGYLVESACLTGSLELSRPTVPWASRFGWTARLR